MRILFSLIFAGIAVRLKPTVTALLQHPLQRFRALAPSGDAFHPIYPPPLHKSLNPATLSRKAQKDGGHPRSAARIHSVLIGCLLLTFGVLTVLAPPGESHDTYTQEDIDNDASDFFFDGKWLGEDLSSHVLPGTAVRLPSDSPHGHLHSTGIDAFFGGGLTAIAPDHFEIQWIRVYKNPKTTKPGEPTKPGRARCCSRSVPILAGPAALRRILLLRRPVLKKGARGCFPSFWKDYEKLWQGTAQLASEADNYFWVDIDPGTGPSDPMSGGLLEDPNKPGNSGRVTATENTWVVPGDIVAIAINVKLRGYKAVKEFITPEPGVDRDSTADPPLKFPPLLHSQVPAYRNPVSGPRTVDWEINHVPLLFNDGQKNNPVDTVWARNFDSTKEIAGGILVAAVGIQHVGILNPNYPLERMTQNGRVYYLHADSSVTASEWGHRDVHGYHTIVYQFTVTKAHESLNALGKVVGRDRQYREARSMVQYLRGNLNYEYADFYAVHPKPAGEDEPHGYTYEDIYDDNTGIRGLTTNDHVRGVWIRRAI